VECPTASGRVAGGASAIAGVVRLLGIPYAAPPVGSLRWQPPQPPESWSGVRSALKPGPRCIQHAPYGELEPANQAFSEDCLYLNVWTPEPSAGAKLPVIVWIHGGEFFAGSGTEPRYDGARLAARGCVVVTLNHRLGVFGFLGHAGLSDESATGTSGNYGLLDLIAGLEWVRENIENFGGDPANVTLAGESAGSCATHAFTTSPLAEGLFHRAIGESGSFFMPEAHAMKPLGHAENEALGQDFMRIAGAGSIADLRAVPGQALLDIWLKAKFPRFQPCTGDHVLPELPGVVSAQGRQQKVPLLAGWNADEYGFMRGAGPRFDQAAYRDALIGRFGAAGTALWDRYVSEAGGDALAAASTLMSDRAFAWPTWKWLGAHARVAPTYAYRFDRPPPGSTFGATHACEIEYVFGTLEARPNPWTGDDRALSGRIGDHWVNFARSGDPNGPVLPQWPRYEGRASPVMRLDVGQYAAPLEEVVRLQALDALYADEA
jgi:para-nitrobenzyl esterase